MPEDNDRCNVALAFHVRRGEIIGVDVGGRSTPGRPPGLERSEAGK
ncbi:hypothetical protein [Arthrobacter ginsengisoli]|nr:hypothetical protein [Arthrobacter ginsengisoli]